MIWYTCIPKTKLSDSCFTFGAIVHTHTRNKTDFCFLDTVHTHTWNQTVRLLIHFQCYSSHTYLKPNSQTSDSFSMLQFTHIPETKQSDFCFIFSASVHTHWKPARLLFHFQCYRSHTYQKPNSQTSVSFSVLQHAQICAGKEKNWTYFT